jgi:GNAT superfamily N-acetyltransferase
VSLVIRAPLAADAAGWRGLWAGYNRFYRASVSAAVSDALWVRLVEGHGAVRALLAEQDGVLVGFAHIVLHPSTWSIGPACYLEDLFVTRSARGADVGRGLIEAVTELARVEGADRVYWHTQEYNGPARSLYDTLAERTSFIVYRREI